MGRENEQTEEEQQMANRHIKIWSPLFILREIQPKTIRYLLKSVRVAHIKILRTIYIGRDVFIKVLIHVW